MKSLSNGGIFYLIYNILNLLFPFLTGIYVARVLLPESIGAVGAAQNLAQYFVILAFLGIPTYGMREMSKVRNDFKERSKLYSELFIINLMSTFCFLLLYIILILIVPAYRNELKLYLIAGCLIALNVFNISWLYEGLEEFKFISVRNVLFKIFSFLLLVVFVRRQEDIYKYVIVTVFGTAGNYVVNMLYSTKYVKFTTKSLHLRRHMKSILYLVAVNLAIELYSLVDITMMNFLSNKQSIAFYKYGQTIERILLQIVNTFTMVIVPRISYYYEKKKINEFNELISKAFKLIIMTSLPMIVGIYLTSDVLLVKLYGQPYIESSYILKTLSVLLIISPTGYLLGSRILLVTGRENKMTISVGIGAIVNIIGNYILIPVYSGIGAGIASLLSEIIVAITYVLLGRKYFKLRNVTSTVKKTIASSMMMGLFLILCNMLGANGWVVLILQIILGVAIYIVSLLVLREEIAIKYYGWIREKISKWI